jgi:hypothetical protein
MKQDRFLIGILVFIGMLVVAALALFFFNPTKPAYLPEDAPEGVFQNYILAIRDGDLERAYSYLADLDHKPTWDVFSQVILGNTLYSQEVVVQVEQVRFLDADQVWLTVSVNTLSTSPFDRGWSNPDHVSLVRQQGNWKLTYMPYPYWGYDWYQDIYQLEKP